MSYTIHRSRVALSLLLTASTVLGVSPSLTLAATSSSSDSVYVMNNPATGDHFYTTSNMERIANSCPNPSNYVADQSTPSFYGYTGPTNGALPVFRLYNPSTGRHFYTLNTGERDSALQGGFQSEGNQFFADVSQKSGETAMYRMYSPSNGNHFYTTDSNERDSAASSAGYVSEGIGFWVSNVITSLPTVWRMISTVSGDHFFASDVEKDSITCMNPAYKFEGVAFKVSATNILGTTAVMRYFNPSSKVHFYTTSSTEGAAATQSGYKNEGPAFYSDPSASLTAYRLRRASGGYYYTTDSNVPTTGHLNDYAYELAAFTVNP